MVIFETVHSFFKTTFWTDSSNAIIGFPPLRFAPPPLFQTERLFQNFQLFLSVFNLCFYLKSLLSSFQYLFSFFPACFFFLDNSNATIDFVSNAERFRQMDSK
ncbi:hypothetical protein KSP39_PZI021977 [Platanthera zijinensis]|uniref:Uncharacterized protein n=1 Tax=Platanthera zijinensis TaxID=2320716 RepID=A0AAP0FWL3_9ASPA